MTTMKCAGSNGGGPARDRRKALGMAALVRGLMKLGPDADAEALVVTTAPRSVGEARSPDHRRSFCAYCLCSAEQAARLTGRDGDFLRAADYFLERLPRFAPARRRALDEAISKEGRP